MEKLVIAGGNRLEGRIRVPGAKNAVLPIIAASIMTDQPVILKGCPRIIDVQSMLEILQTLGCQVRTDRDVIYIMPEGVSGYQMPGRLSKEVRSSIFMLGPILGRLRKAVFTYPGGCEIGLRPIDLHLKGLRALGVQTTEDYGLIVCDGSNLHGGIVHLDYPSVGATENVMMAAVLADGETVIHNAAKEPEIVDLQNFLNRMDARISGAGTDTVSIRGVRKLRGAEYEIIPDRIVAGTYLIAGAITGGDITIDHAVPEHMRATLAKLSETGCDIDIRGDSIRLRAPGRIGPIARVETQPHPGFPTDMQAQVTALACTADGTSVIMENIFENRFKYVGDLIRMGADIAVHDRAAIIRGVSRLSGASVTARDLRAGAALTLAGLSAQGITTVENVRLIDRGYERLDLALNSLGADIGRT